MKQPDLLCIGHRGAKGYAPENTLAAFQKAIDLGAACVELDVYHLEGQLIVHHDHRLERTTNGNGYLIDRELAYLRSLDAGGGEKIPTLAEVFQLIDRRCGINIELKGAGTAQPVVEFVHQMAREGWPRNLILVSSFNHRELARVRELDPDIRLGALMVGLPVNDAAFAAALDAYSVHPSIEFIDRRFVDDAHERGLKVFVFTVNRPEDIRRMADLGVDGLFSDYPDRVLELAPCAGNRIGWD